MNIARILVMALLPALVLTSSPGTASPASADIGQRAAASGGSVAFMASAPKPSRIPKDRCAAVKFNWGVASSHVNSAFWGTLTVKQGRKTIAVHRVERTSPNRWNYVMGRVCTPGTITMTVRGEFYLYPNPNQPVLQDKILDRRSYVIR